MSTPQFQPAERHFINAALACAYAGEGESLIGGLTGLPQPLRDRLERAISEKLAQHACRTGDWSVFADAAWFLRMPALREAAQPFRDRLDALARAARRDRAPDSRRRDLARLALRLLRNGAVGRELLSRLDDMNNALPEPLPPEVVGQIAVWAARAAREAAHAA